MAVEVRVTIKKNAEDVIIVTEDHGGYKEGYCFACEASGWIDGFGYPCHAKGVPANRLKHKHYCSMNDVLNDDGSLKQ